MILIMLNHNTYTYIYDSDHVQMSLSITTWIDSTLVDMVCIICHIHRCQGDM